MKQFISLKKQFIALLIIIITLASCTTGKSYEERNHPNMWDARNTTDSLINAKIK